jgi:hypothetical protein
MGQRVIDGSFKCLQDCAMSGCPGHVMTMNINTVSDSVSLLIDGKEWFLADTKMIEKLFVLAKMSDYFDFRDMRGEATDGK